MMKTMMKKTTGSLKRSKKWCCILMYYLECYDLSQEKIQKHRENVDDHNELLQLDYSLKNLSILKRYKERNNEVYQADLNNWEFQNNLREWRRSKR